MKLPNATDLHDVIRALARGSSKVFGQDWADSCGMSERGDTLCTSVFTVGEVLTGPYRRGAMEVPTQIRAAFHSTQTELIPFTEETADRYARIRGTHRVSPADAVHLASGAEAGVDVNLF